jgi:hypothetical protein
MCHSGDVMKRIRMPAVVCVLAAMAVVPARVAAQNNTVVPETKTIRNTRIELGEEKPGITKIGETKAIKIGESRAIKIGEQPSERFKKIGLDVDLKAAHEAAFGPLGQNDWATSAVPVAAVQPAGSTNAPPSPAPAAGASSLVLQQVATTNAPAPPQAVKAGPAKAAHRGGSAAKICVVTGLPCSEMCPAN